MYNVLYAFEPISVFSSVYFEKYTAYNPDLKMYCWFLLRPPAHMSVQVISKHRASSYHRMRVCGWWWGRGRGLGVISGYLPHVYTGLHTGFTAVTAACTAVYSKSGEKWSKVMKIYRTITVNMINLSGKTLKRLLACHKNKALKWC